MSLNFAHVIERMRVRRLSHLHHRRLTSWKNRDESANMAAPRQQMVIKDVPRSLRLCFDSKLATYAEWRSRWGFATDVSPVLSPQFSVHYNALIDNI